MTPVAQNPFRFFSRLTLSFATGVKARTLREFMEGLTTLPDSVIYQHTYRFVQEHQFLVPEPPNDFAAWSTHTLQNESLGEALSSVDTTRFDTLSDLRATLEVILRKAMTEWDPDRAVPEGKEFHFQSGRRFSLLTPFTASTLTEFSDALKRISLSSLYLHLFESRLRPPLGINDFSHWFEKELGEIELAKSIAELDPYNNTLEDLRSRLVHLIDRRISHVAS